MSHLPISALRSGPVPPSTAKEKELRAASAQLEGVFVAQLFKAMRATVPQDGLMGGGAGEEIFQSMMDEHLAAQAPRDWDRGLGAGIYRQLRGALHGAAPDAAATNGTGDSH
ncbi:MAG TPA: rod-binding protein [Longimicrobiaceae bacterium]|nr:rod-binding protein [Longimicrobiaceae bacterium]